MQKLPIPGLIPGRVQHEASARRGINSVTQNSRFSPDFQPSTVGNLTVVETFELSNAFHPPFPLWKIFTIEGKIEGKNLGFLGGRWRFLDSMV